MSPWLRVLREGQQPRARLVCLPHAGGSASFFRPWLAHLPGDIDLLAVQYRPDQFTYQMTLDVDASGHD